MNLRDLEYILAVADKKHFGLAADACGVSQPGLSAQIRKLEDELGIRLFDRTPRGVTVMPQAVYVIEQARVIVDKAADIRRHARLLRSAKQPKIVNLGVIPTIAPYFLPEFFRRAGDCGVRWQIVEEKTETLLQRLNDGRLDAAILSLPAGAGLPSQAFFNEPFYLAVPQDHPLAARKQVTPADTAGEDFLLLDDGHCLNDHTLSVCDAPAARHSFRASSLETLRHMVAGGSGLTLMPDMARRADDGIVYLPLDSGAYVRTVGMVWRAGGLYRDDIENVARRVAGEGARKAA